MRQVRSCPTADQWFAIAQQQAQAHGLSPHDAATLRAHWYDYDCDERNAIMVGGIPALELVELRRALHVAGIEDAANAVTDSVHHVLKRFGF